MALQQRLGASSSVAVRGQALARPAAVPRQRAQARRVAVQRTQALATADTDTSRFIPRWSTCYQFLRSKGLQTVSPEEASKLVEGGEWVLVDVRRADHHATAAPKGAVNVPLYQKLEAFAGGFDGKKVLKTVMYLFNGVDPIEPNPEFLEQLKKAAGGKGVIFACEAGGTLKPSINFAEGKASRSLQACYKALAVAGLDKVKHLERGIYGWYQADLPFTGDYKPDIGRFPTAAAEPTLQGIVQARGYEMRPDDKKSDK